MIQPIAVTDREGGVWIPWERWSKQDWPKVDTLIHSIMFDDGSIFDAINGWRQPSKYHTPHPMEEGPELDAIMLARLQDGYRHPIWPHIKVKPFSVRS